MWREAKFLRKAPKATNFDEICLHYFCTILYSDSSHFSCFPSSWPWPAWMIWGMALLYTFGQLLKCQQTLCPPSHVCSWCDRSSYQLSTASPSGLSGAWQSCQGAIDGGEECFCWTSHAGQSAGISHMMLDMWSRCWVFGGSNEMGFDPQYPDSSFVMQQAQDVVSLWVDAFKKKPHLFGMLQSRSNGLDKKNHKKELTTYPDWVWILHLKYCTVFMMEVLRSLLPDGRPSVEWPLLWLVARCCSRVGIRTSHGMNSDTTSSDSCSRGHERASGRGGWSGCRNWIYPQIKYLWASLQNKGEENSKNKKKELAAVLKLMLAIS